jgi:hypothetical protein
VTVDNTGIPLPRTELKNAAPSIKKTTGHYSAARVKQIVHFVKMLRARIATVLPADRKKPLQFPIFEIRYAKRCVDRLKEHARHHSSNYII